MDEAEKQEDTTVVEPEVVTAEPLELEPTETGSNPTPPEAPEAPESAPMTRETPESIQNRVAMCSKDIEAVLEKWGCNLTVQQGVGITPLQRA